MPHDSTVTFEYGKLLCDLGLDACIKRLVHYSHNTYLWEFFDPVWASWR